MRHLSTKLEPYRHRPLLVSETIHVTGIRGTNFDLCSIGVVPEGSRGRQEFGGPEVAGPWGFATTHSLVIDDCGGSARERELALKVAAGEPLTIDGLPGVWTLTGPRSIFRDGDGPRLTRFVGPLAAHEQTRAELAVLIDRVGRRGLPADADVLDSGARHAAAVQAALDEAANSPMTDAELEARIRELTVSAI